MKPTMKFSPGVLVFLIEQFVLSIWKTVLDLFSRLVMGHDAFGSKLVPHLLGSNSRVHKVAAANANGFDVCRRATHPCGRSFPQKHPKECASQSEVLLPTRVSESNMAGFATVCQAPRQTITSEMRKGALERCGPQLPRPELPRVRLESPVFEAYVPSAKQRRTELRAMQCTSEALQGFKGRLANTEETSKKLISPT